MNPASLDPNLQISLLEKTRKLTHLKRMESPEDWPLRRIELQLKYLSKLVAGKRPNRNRLSRIEFSKEALNFTANSSEQAYAGLLVDSHKIAKMLLERAKAAGSDFKPAAILHPQNR